MWPMVLGFALLVFAWILAVPPFRATDEFDHAFRAAAVARGEWLPSTFAGPRGGRAYVTVPKDIVEAAYPQCARLSYKRADDCSGFASPSPGQVSIASGAARYNPVFYAVVGSVARPFGGVAALYAMRCMAAALCAGMFALSLWVIRTWARGPSPFIAVAVACAPVVLFSDGVAAPNGLEIMAGLALSTSLVGLRIFRGAASPGVVAAATVSGCVLVTLRSLGPLWALLIVLAVFIGSEDRRRLIGDLWRRSDIRLGLGLVLVAAMASCAWIVLVRPLGGSPSVAGSSILEGLRVGVVAMPGWLLQCVAAFPFRTQLAPPVVYASAGIAFLWMVARGLQKAALAERIAIEVVLVASLGLPLALTAVSFGPLGEVVWQGRYGLPFTLIALVLAGASLDKAGTDHDLRSGGRWRAALLVVLNVVVQVPGALKVLVQERASDPAEALQNWFMPADWEVILLATAGAAIWMFAASRAGRANSAQVLDAAYAARTVRST